MVDGVTLEMRGITGETEDYLKVDCEATVFQAMRRAISKDKPLKDVKKVMRDSLLSILWERTKQRPMVIVNLLEV